MVKNPPANVGNVRDVGLIRVRKIPWRRAQQPSISSTFLPEESHTGNWWAMAHRVTELDMTETT